MERGTAGLSAVHRTITQLARRRLAPAHLGTDTFLGSETFLRIETFLGKIAFGRAETFRRANTSVRNKADVGAITVCSVVRLNVFIP